MTTEIDNIHLNYSESKPELSEIQSFYNGATVFFLTGATGFLGNLLLEKIIRTCSGVKRIYILIREKKGLSTEIRFKELFNDPVFEVMKKEQPNFIEKISAVIGDCKLPNLGIGEQNIAILKNEINIVIHSAATVRFDEHLRTAVNINIVALQDLIKLSQQMKDLKSFVHISTAYSNCVGRDVVDEIFYKPPISGNQLVKILDCLDDNYITKITPVLLNEWPNTYAMTKAVAESEILTYGKGLPIGIVRPSMIITTYKEPIPGWINNVYGPTGIVAATGVGLLRCMCANPNFVADLIPGDFVINSILAASWDIHIQWKEHNNSNNIIQSNCLSDEAFLPPIFNSISSNTNPLTWGEFSAISRTVSRNNPSSKLIWPVMLKLTGNKNEFNIYCFLLHTIPAYIVDFLARLTGRKPKLMDAYRKIHKFCDVIAYFSLQSWTFNDKNMQSLWNRLSKLDQSLFNFDIANMDWYDFLVKHAQGIRLYVLKDPLTTVEEGRKLNKKLYMLHYTVITVLTAFLLMILYYIFVLIMK